MRLEISDLMTYSFCFTFLYMKYVTRKFIKIRSKKVFSLNFWYFNGIIYFIGETTKVRYFLIRSFDFYIQYHFCRGFFINISNGFLQTLFICVVLIYLNLSSRIRKFFIYFIFFWLQCVEFCAFNNLLFYASLTFFKCTGTVFSSTTSTSFTFVFKLIKLAGTSSNLLMYSLSTSAFKAKNIF